MKKIISFCISAFTLVGFVEAQFFNNDNEIIKNLGLNTIPNTIQEQTFNTKGTLKNFQIIGPNTKARCFHLTFNEKGNLIEEKQLNPKNLEEIIATHTFQFAIEKDYKKSENIPNSEAQYDEKGNCISRTFFNDDKILLSKSIYTYDAQNNLLSEEIFDSNLRPFIQHLYKYNEKNHCIEIHKKTADNSINILLKYQYTYDERDNWIERIEIEKGFVYTLTKRSYTYH